MIEDEKIIEKKIEKLMSSLPKQKFPGISGLAKKIAREMVDADCFETDISISKSREVSVCVAGDEVEAFKAAEWVPLAVSPVDVIDEILANERIYDYCLELQDAVSMRFKKNPEIRLALAIDDNWGESLADVCSDFFRKDYESDGRLRTKYQSSSDDNDERDWEVFAYLAERLSERIKQEKLNRYIAE